MITFPHHYNIVSHRNHCNQETNSGIEHNTSRCTAHADDDDDAKDVRQRNAHAEMKRFHSAECACTRDVDVVDDDDKAMGDFIEMICA